MACDELDGFYCSNPIIIEDIFICQRTLQAVAAECRNSKPIEKSASNSKSHSGSESAAKEFDFPPARQYTPAKVKNRHSGYFMMRNHHIYGKRKINADAEVATNTRSDVVLLGYRQLHPTRITSSLSSHGVSQVRKYSDCVNEILRSTSAYNLNDPSDDQLVHTVGSGLVALGTLKHKPILPPGGRIPIPNRENDFLAKLSTSLCELNHISQMPLILDTACDKWVV
ncbi:hypothetical protein Ciccas_001381 [Cichlidogyrus casuarinus]|uniref:Uncharacterized protein n=1 Tax=Cichlidogyrus casuarinus TaxID=1844966 RepID=A0ABD2QK70_9PLAT